jgi:hypothetical protein
MKTHGEGLQGETLCGRESCGAKGEQGLDITRIQKDITCKTCIKVFTKQVANLQAHFKELVGKGLAQRH